MTSFESQFFRKFKYTKEQTQQYLHNAVRDLDIARRDPFAEVRLTFCYQALLKTGIALIAREGFKIRSIPGHHVKILEKMSEILKDPDIFVYGNAMRTKRNLDLYEGGTILGEKEIDEFITFVEELVATASQKMEGRKIDKKAP